MTRSHDFAPAWPSDGALLSPWPGPSGVAGGGERVEAIRALAAGVVAGIPGAVVLVDPVGFDPVVYVALASDGDVLYVGRSHDLVARIGRHRHAFDSLRAPRPVAWASVRVPAPLAPAAEEGLIVALRPQINRARAEMTGASRRALNVLGWSL